MKRIFNGRKRIRELEEEVARLEFLLSEGNERCSVVEKGYLNFLRKCRELENKLAQLESKYCDEVAKRVEITEKYIELEGKLAKGEMKHGEWFLLDDCANEGVYCSVCHKKVYKKYYENQKLKSKYCPNCAAKMDGGKEE